jgi:hypothetical protein
VLLQSRQLSPRRRQFAGLTAAREPVSFAKKRNKIDMEAASNVYGLAAYRMRPPVFARASDE